MESWRRATESLDKAKVDRTGLRQPIVLFGAGCAWVGLNNFVLRIHVVTLER
jgi:hypothetical protein